jgi:hypothetical protein
VDERGRLHSLGETPASPREGDAEAQNQM